MNEFFTAPYDEQTMADAQQAAADKAVGDVVDTMCASFCQASGEAHILGTTAIQDVDRDVVHNAFKLDNPMLG